jgi:hypothetical protein
MVSLIKSGKISENRNFNSAFLNNVIYIPEYQTDTGIKIAGLYDKDGMIICRIETGQHWNQF